VIITNPRALLHRFTPAGRIRRRNARYDDLTTEIIQRVLGPSSNAVDVGCFRGKILDEMVRQAPAGHHVAFEPNPDLAARLRARFPAVTIHEVAVSDEPGTGEFHVLTQLPAQSGLLRRPTDRDSDVRVIEVKVDTIDRLLPEHLPIGLVKIDVEGAEVNVLRGARETLRRWQPVVVFEHGVRTSQPYGTTPEMLFDLLADCGLNVSLLDRWLDGAPPFSRREFLHEKYDVRRHWMFVAGP
jgi:FkbM family methyltransferase